MAKDADEPMPARHMAVNDVPSTFAGYRIGRQLSVDTVSTTYRVSPQRQSAGQSGPVAMRISIPLRTDDAPDAGTASAFISALADAVAVTHPALVAIMAAGEVDDRVYVVTEQVAGPSLDQYLRDHGPLDVADAVALLRPIAEGLDLAHAADVVHGAVSPRTIVVDQRADRRPGSPPALLTGFGLECLLSRQIQHDRAAADVLDVTYVAPEQLGGATIDGRADQYALACALYHCVVGRAPFVRDSVAALFGAHLFSDAHVPADRGNPALAYAIGIGMAKRPQERHASCATLMTAAERTTVGTRDAAAAPASSDPDGVPSAVGPVASPPDDRVASAGGDRDRPTRGRRRARSAVTPVRIRADEPIPSLSEQAAARRVHGQTRHRRLPIPWPLAAMLVLAGILFTLALAAILRNGRSAPDDTSGGVGAQVSNGVAVANPDEQSRSAPAVPATVQWERRVSDTAIGALATDDDAVVVASQNSVMELAAGDGSRRWSRVAAGEAVGGVVAIGDVVGLHASGIRVLSGRDGGPLWSHRDVLAPLGGLAADDTTFYGIRQGRVTAELVAFDAATGGRRWRFDGGQRLLGRDAAVAVAEAQVAVLDDDRLLVVDVAARRPSGQVVPTWTVDLIDPWVRSLVVGRDTVVVAGHDGRLCAYALADGGQTWCADVVGMTDHEPTVVVADGAVTVTVPSHVAVFALKSGALRWSFGAQEDLLPITVAQDDQVVVAESSGTVHGLDVVRGYEVWQASGLGEVTTLAADSEAAYVGTADGHVVRIRSARASAPPG